MNKGGITNSVKSVGYRMGKFLAKDDIRAFDTMDQLEAQDIADTVFKEEYHATFIKGYEAGFAKQVEDNMNREVRRLEYDRMQAYRLKHLHGDNWECAYKMLHGYPDTDHFVINSDGIIVKVTD